MSFGQQSGPPASDKQVRYLLSLVQQAGYTDFREARHPLSLTQRQARGKFTGREASELIDRLLAGQPADDVSAASPAPRPVPGAPRPARSGVRTLGEVPLERLVAELGRRGYKVVPEVTDPPASPQQPPPPRP